ncbi:methyl-accepting chemotaxis protein [Marinomonas mediterranea]|jgi:Methyl-accepting chemotaxis protein|uniref:Methyl-accepting chemotaxis sensory transducer n=1 Tax=Marinomonas mediterranea (strain ATCC 700492 / JCM 21426 / NBRC 103028 / MMB-1) TaxID=717774 RepID=F2JUX8_MARM1|nr:methyl-accepting chemotaxis protein [Marinomonas mediterranea]ADZ91632.1 methyl-accepting chemotaxis sensory transducer [Marinomonas mediterranea MMB-1]WCN09590.1 HAMP domain-containing protein [Marinomonas mediterranea]WCN13678.1 HAMP domain-containing protein [Marinomonas mediterranea]WCN17733.1 HAMP domain-containing protein [Marinomonas mediterranea MMB-1]
MNNLSMRAKFIALVSSIIIVFLVALSVMKSKSTELVDSFNRFYNENHATSLNLERIKEAQVSIMLNVRGLQIAYLLSLDKQIPPYLDAISEGYKNTPELFSNLNEGFNGEANALRKLQDLTDDFEGRTRDFVKAMQDADDNKAPFSVFSAFITSYNKLMEHFSDLTKQNNSEVLKAKQASETLVTEIEFNFWGAILIALAVSLTLGYIISNNIVNGIRTVRSAAQSMAEGYLNKPISIAGHDEISDLGGAINTTTQNLRTVIDNVLSSVNTVNENSQGVLKANNDVAECSLEIMENTEQVVVALDQMSANNHTISDNTQQSAEAANEIRKVAQTSLSTAHNTLDAINELVAALKETNGVVSELRNETNNIETILGVIRGIAEQTNLLALNAAIEAARAGESGRGFAVVADEVRGLAQRSQDSVNEIEALLLKLNNASNRAVSQMDSSLVLVESSHDQVAQGNELTSNILERIEGISDQTQQIASSAAEQISVSEDINRKMHSVRDLTQHNAEIAKSSGLDMAENSVDVQQQLSFFKL